METIGNSGGGSDGVDEIVAKGPEDVLRQYFPLAWRNCPRYDGGDGDGGSGGSGGNGGSGDGGGGGDGVNVRFYVR